MTNQQRRGRVEGKVAFITGAGRGQGRSHAIRLAEEGADVIAVDLSDTASKDISRFSPYPMATEADLEETARLVTATGRDILTRHVDVRDQESLDAAVAAGKERFGHIDIVSANAGIGGTYATACELTRANWQAVIDVDLTGVWQTAKAAAPVMIEQGNGGSIIITTSTMGLKGLPNMVAYIAAKHGAVGVMRALTHELGPFSIRVNAIAPCSVDTDMIFNDAIYQLFRPDLTAPTKEDTIDAFQAMNIMPVPWNEARDISEAVLWLASDEARHVTGIVLPVDAGQLAK
ncbi:mycofactocin-coupled SDR family oxidoreductase [Pseudofrankia sp. BMG5.36]|uniref:mycofactocin-coupled SDR family oxidoreductase n=2 Tax=Pseudofrankia sp. BMG5.36 TaxID=1834512 RepID=UPI0008DAF0C4|nr:mycofactocin-coupled SDR family oxidoreductase [Pseudofrankia sp. BMG5.36]OHV52153.1 3-ketoacyl-ACP reductase [Pseudofrankia sp. BMG5.36]